MNTKLIKLSAVVLSTVVFTTSAQAVSFSFINSSGQDLIYVGDSVTLNLDVSDLGQNTAPSLGAYNFDINFQSTNVNLAANGITLGDQQLQLNNINSINNQDNINLSTINANGQFNLSEVSLNDSDTLNGQQADNFTLATFTFTATEIGQTPVGLNTIQLSDADGRNLSANNANTSFFVFRDLKKTLPSLTELQNNTGRTLQKICQKSQGVGIGEDPLTSLACGIDTVAVESPEQLPGILQNVAAEEIFVPAAMSTRVALGLFTELERQLSSRRTAHKGIATNNVNLSQNGQQFNFGLSGILGGSAGDESSLVSNLGGFITGSAKFGETDSTQREDGFSFNNEGVVLGLDYHLNNEFIAGLALGYSYYNANFHRSSLVAGGDTESNAFMASLYSTYYLDNFYLDTIFSYTHSDYDVTRKISIPPLNISTASASPESNQYAGSLGIGYTFNRGGLTLSPFVKLSYLDLEISAYQEAGAGSFNQSFDDQQADSLETVIGTQISYAISQSFGVIIPEFRAEWHHEFLENSQTVNARLGDTPITYRSSDPDRDFANLSVGVSGAFKHGLQAFLNYETILAQKNVESHAFSAGLRLEF